MSDLPTFKLVNVSSAVTYHLRDPAVLGAFAMCTINDATGELAISSDWGSWSYQWSPRPENLGAPSLSHFIADRKSYNYLADKLYGGGYSGRVFDPDASVTTLQKEIAKTRLEQGRFHADHAESRWEKRRYISYMEEPLTAGIAREVWDELEHLRDVRSEELFLERLFRITGCAWLPEEPWNMLETEVAHAYTVLSKAILPALVAAVEARLRDEDAAREERPTP